jgi:hypothetical protein
MLSFEEAAPLVTTIYIHLTDKDITAKRKIEKNQNCQKTKTTEKNVENPSIKSLPR